MGCCRRFWRSYLFLHPHDGGGGGAAHHDGDHHQPDGSAVFAAPANVNIGADASVSGGTVDSVQFFANGVSAGSVLTSPFHLTANNLAAGAYALTAVATAAGISAISAVVNITVVPAPTVSITNPASGAVFVAPANVHIAASATVTRGTGA